MGKNETIHLTEQQIYDVEKLAGKMNCANIAHKLGVSESTFLRIRQRQPEVMTAYLKGKAQVIELAANVVIEAIENKDLQAAYFYLRTQAGWSEKPKRTLTQNMEKLDFSTPETKAKSCNKLAQIVTEHEEITVDDVLNLLKMLITPAATTGLEVVQQNLHYKPHQLAKLQELLTEFRNENKGDEVK